jgi:hypothetical protein
VHCVRQLFKLYTRMQKAEDYFYMKKLEITIPHRRLNDASEIKGANTGGMSHYKIEGRGMSNIKCCHIVNT